MRRRTASPTELGVDPGGLAAFVDALEAAPDIEPHGLLVQRHGVRVAEAHWAPYTADRLRLVYSLSKTFTGTALGLAVAEGRLGLDDLVAYHLPDLLDGADPRTRRMRIRHIASMSSGHDHEMIDEAIAADPEDLLRGFFGIPPAYEPGTYFQYNQPPVLALATVVHRLVGSSLSDYLRPRLTDPLGVPALRWRRDPSGVELGFSGAHTTLAAVAGMGQLYLDDGLLLGRRVLPLGWVTEASSRLADTPREPEVDWQRGYGLTMWQSRHGYRGDGAYGQFMLVLPEQDAVVALFTATHTLQGVLDATWTHLLPAFVDPGASAGVAGVAGVAGDDDRALAERLARCAVPTARQRTSGSSAAGVRAERLSAEPRPAGRVGAADDVEGQPTLTSVELTGDAVVLVEGASRMRVPVGDDWAVAGDGAVAGSAAVVEGGRVVVDLLFLDTPHRLELVADLGSSTCRSRWATQPILRPGPMPRLADLRSPGA